jgi:transposase
MRLEAFVQKGDATDMQLSRYEDCMQNVAYWADRIKILVWDRTGLVLVHKRLEGCKFVWPTIADGVMRISPAMFAALFEGLDWRLVRPEEARRPQAAG